MKNKICAPICAFLALSMLLYLMVSFYYLSFDISNWEKVARAMIVFVFIPAILAISIFIYVEIERNK